MNKAIKSALMAPLVLVLFIAIFSPTAASAAVWVLPSGAIYDDQANTVTLPAKVRVIHLPNKDAAKICTRNAVNRITCSI